MKPEKEMEIIEKIAREIDYCPDEVWEIKEEDHKAMIRYKAAKIYRRYLQKDE